MATKALTDSIHTMNQPAKPMFARFAFAVLVVAVAYFYNLGSMSLWGDEAGTGVFARNVLKFGLPTGFDGRNLSIYDSGAELNSNLLVVKIPWIQFYLGALSIRLFGDDEQGLRTVFAFLGVITIWPIFSVLRNRIASPLFVATLVLITPQVLLFHRNARYYSTLTLLFAILVWTVCQNDLTRRSRTVLCTLAMVFMFHTHPVAAATCGLGLLLQALWHRQGCVTYLLSCGLGFGSWLLWYAFVGPTLIAPSLFPEFKGQTLIQCLSIVTQNLVATVYDLDAVQGMPLLAWAIGLIALFKVYPERLTQFIKDPLVVFVGTTLAVHLVVVSVLFGTETEDRYALLRYMPHLVVFGLVVLFILVSKLVEDSFKLTTVGIALVATNIWTLSYWQNPSEKPIPFSWWPFTYQEILHPQREAWDSAMQIINQDSSIVEGGFETLAVVPQWLQEVAIYYLGHKLIIAPNLDPDSIGERIVRLRIGDKAYSNFQKPPKWVIYELPQAPMVVPGYERTTLPIHRYRPDDGTRPELTRHTFFEREVAGEISLYRRIQ